VDGKGGGGRKQHRTNSDMLVGNLGKTKNNTTSYCGDRYQLIQFPSHFNFLSLMSREMYLAQILVIHLQQSKSRNKKADKKNRKNIMQQKLIVSK
jgi:hypothetical protein